jgi:hypothetical protein
MKRGVKLGSKRTWSSGNSRWSKGLIIERTGDPVGDLIISVFREAICSAKKGEEDAIEWLVAEDGAVLWLRAMGFGIRPSMQQRLRELTLDRD